MPPETQIDCLLIVQILHHRLSLSKFRYIPEFGIYLCFTPANDNNEFKPTFAQYGVNTPRLDLLGHNVGNEFIA